MIRGVECIDKIQEQHDRETLASTLGIKEAYYFAQLSHCTWISAECLLSILYIFLGETRQSLGNDLLKNSEFCADASYRSKVGLETQ